MPSPLPSQHITPPEIDEPRFQGENPGKDNSNFLTLALNPKWLPAYDWADKNDVLYELLLIANATYLKDEYRSIGRLLEVITADTPIALLAKWEYHEEAARHLMQLARAAIRSPDIFQLYPPLSTSKPAAQQFKKKLDENYLIALIIEKISSDERADPSWLESLKTWVITHAVHRALHGNYQDQWLREVSTELRKACNLHPKWRAPFLLLKSSTDDFGELSRNIAYKANRLLSLRRKHQLTTDHENLLVTISKVAGRQFAEDSTPSNRHSIIPLPLRMGYKSTAKLTLAGTEAIPDEADAGLSHTEWVTPTEETGEDIFGTDTNSKDTFTHQKLQGNTVILHCTEELQYLPNSWSKPNHLELTRIREWLKNSHAHGSEATRYIAAVVGLALGLGRTFRRALDIEISSTPTREWSLNPKNLGLCRIPPRREPGWKPHTDEQRDWISVPAQQQVHYLPAEVTEILSTRIEHLKSPRTIGDLWDTSWGTSVEQHFSIELSRIAPRVTAGMLAYTLPQKIFEETGDSTFTRLLTSHPQSALPGSCAYSSWATADIAHALNSETRDTSRHDNAMGSLLDPIETKLQQSIRNATRELVALSQGGNLITFHNAYVSYVATETIAATGERPVNDPVESIRHFDFEHRFLYISDKVSNELRQARLVPIPRRLTDRIQKEYVPHLLSLSRMLEATSPELAKNIIEMLKGNNSACMPFLFFLTSDGKSWESVTEKGIGQTKLFDWPLPLNHFRHRIAKKLRQNHLDSEIIDCILGHAEVGSATCGDYSFRIWKEDMELARPALEACHTVLGFAEIPPWTGAHQPLNVQPAGTRPAKGDRPYGSAAREIDRKRRLINSVRDARIQIQTFIRGRDIADLSEDELNQLSNELLFHKNGMPHPSGYIKYRILLKRIERTGRKHGKKAKTSRLYQMAEQERSPFNEHAPSALHKFDKITSIASGITTSGITRQPTKELAITAALLLCIESRITNLKILTDILEAKNFGIVSMYGTYYLEHGKGLDGIPDNVPAQHFRISKKTTQYLDQLLSKRRENKVNKIPKVLQDIIDACEITLTTPEDEPSVEEIIQHIATIVDQVNSMTLPGIAASYLAGRIETYSLPWRDRARLEFGQAVQMPSQKSDDQIQIIDLNAAPISSAATIKTLNNSDVELQQAAAFDYLQAIENIIRNPANADKGAAIKNRKRIAIEIQKVIDSHSGMISSALLLLGKWAVELLFRKSKGKFIQLASIDRYLGALKQGFGEVGYNIDIMNCDDDDVTDFYCDLFEAIDVKNTQYVADRLGDFHKWARVQYAIPDPDWSALPALTATIRVSPGAISEREYKNALRLIMRRDKHDNDLKLNAAMLLLLCYRFALRGKDALGLARSDVDIDRENIFVYVQNNRYRRLKVPTSRRQVPLLFQLSGIEVKVLKNFLANHESVHGSDLSAPLFFDLRKKIGITESNKIKRLTINSLKAATLDNNVNLHHARHSAANAIGLALASIYAPENRKKFNRYGSSIRDDIEQVLLGRTGKTRRMIWAISRFLGHARRQTTCRNYLHFLDDFTALHVAIDTDDETIKLINATIIEDLPRLAKIDTTLLDLHEEKFAPPNVREILKLMRLIARGVAAQDAALMLEIHTDHATKLESLLVNIGERVKLSRSKFNDDNLPPLHRLLRRIKEPAWNRLIEEIPHKNHLPPDIHKPYLSDEELMQIIGNSRQIRIWESKHVQFINALIHFLDLSKDEYDLVTVLDGPSKLRELMAQHKLHPICRKDQRVQTRFQIDPIYLNDGQYKVIDRGAFAIRENDSKPVRNGVELLAVLIAFSMAEFKQT